MGHMPPLHVRMAPRDPTEPHRTSTQLELFFDLAFVVAVAQAAGSMHHLLVDGHAGDALFAYPLAFFGIWWAWMNFTWFASAYDCDDVPYRIATFVQMTGVLIFAAGIPRGFEDRDLGVMTAGYVVMRLALVAQWLRVAASHPERRTTALRYAIGISAVQVAWVVRLAVPDSWLLPSFVVLAVCELAVPMWAERAGRTSWHAHHIVERYGLFTIIVLGESVLSATIAVQAVLDADGTVADIATVVIGGLLIVYSMWWIYFALPVERMVDRARREFEDDNAANVFAWGYGHYVILAAIAAAGAGIAVAIDGATDHSTLSDVESALVLTVPVAVYLVAVWVLHYRDKDPGPLRSWVPPVAAVLVLAASFTPEPVLVTGVLLAGLVASSVVLAERTGAGVEVDEPAGAV